MTADAHLSLHDHRIPAECRAAIVHAKDDESRRAAALEIVDRLRDDGHAIDAKAAPDLIAQAREARATLSAVHRANGGEGAEKNKPFPITVEAARLPADWIESEQQPPPFIVDGLLPEAEAGSLVGPGGTMKSTIKLFESVHLILGRDLYRRRVAKSGPVVAVSKEDRASLIDYRLKQICLAMRLSPADMRHVQSNFLRLVLRGDAFMLQRISSDRIPFRSADVETLCAVFRGEGIVSAWFDTASRFATGEGNQEAAVTLDSCTVIADEWHCASELLHHVSQGIARTGTVDMHAGRGGTAFVDNGRFARQMLRHTGETLPGAIVYQPPFGIDTTCADLFRIHTVKLTGARFDMHAPVWIERRDEWEFVCVQGESGTRPNREQRKADTTAAQDEADDIAVLAFVYESLRKSGGDDLPRLTQNSLIEVRNRIVKGMSAIRVRHAVGRLKQDQKLVEVPIQDVVRGPRSHLIPAGWTR